MADDDDSEVWEGAWKAVQLLKPVTGGEYSAQMTICERANDGLIRSIAEKFICQGKVEHDVELPAWFWWARGNANLKQNWNIGDFETTYH
jgi:hypothetical protein